MAWVLLPQLGQSFKNVWQGYPWACELPNWSPAAEWPEAFAVHFLAAFLEL